MLKIAKGLTTPELVDSVTENVLARKQIKEPSNLKEAVSIIMTVVEQVNALSELDKVCGGTRLEDLMLPDWTKTFLYPSKVALTPDFAALDLVERPTKDSAFTYDEAEVTKAAYVISSTVKGKPNMTNVSSLRPQNSMLSEVRYAIGNNVKQSDNEIFLPIPLTDKLSVLLGLWSNTTVDKMITLFFSRTDIVK
jgi:hypothetical protein